MFKFDLKQQVKFKISGEIQFGTIHYRSYEESDSIKNIRYSIQSKKSGSFYIFTEEDLLKVNNIQEYIICENFEKCKLDCFHKTKHIPMSDKQDCRKTHCQSGCIYSGSVCKYL